MERNWLIRTTQNQILGPVAKQKLLEFIQKGALGAMDEVTSGNGYWFSLREKDLVEKYLYGDIPQGYNPISESKSVLAKREKPELTSSINLSPANKTQSQKINPANAALPTSSDLDFPDVTLVGKMPDLQPLKQSGPLETRLPDSSDLEFPDIGLITSNVNSTFNSTLNSKNNAQVHSHVSQPVQMTKKTDSIKNSGIEEDVHFPDEDDLEFPDLSSSTSPKIEKGKVDLNQQYTRTVALDNNQLKKDLPSVLQSSNEEEWNFDVTVDSSHSKTENLTKTEAGRESREDKQQEDKPKDIAKAKKFEIPAEPEEKKLLFERKTKSSKSPANLRDPEREAQSKAMGEVSGPLKKRNDNYLFFILIIIILIIVTVFFYFKEILNKPLPV